MGRLFTWEQQPPFLFQVRDYKFIFVTDVTERKFKKIISLGKAEGNELSILCCTLRRVTAWLVPQCLGTELLCLRSSCMWRGVCGSGGKFVPGFWGLELRSVRKICRESVPQWKKKSSSRQNGLPADWSQGSTSEGGRDLISGRCSGDVVGQPFAETVLKGMTLKIPCSFKSMNGNKVFLFGFF